MKSCRSDSTPICKYPCKCQGLCLMREFVQKHEDKCKTDGLPEPANKSQDFMTGSSYDGEWQKGCMHGYGVYTFNNGVIYEGELSNGMFHGMGELRYEMPARKAIIRGHWEKGVMTESAYLLEGSLEYDPENWQYCKMPDRRFKREYADGVQPSGKSFMTASQPYVDVPEGCYDTGDGLFDITSKVIYAHDDHTKLLRGPAIAEQRWIQNNCRMAEKDLPTGPVKNLYEKYMEPTAYLEPVPPPPVKLMLITREDSTFEECEDLENAPLFYDASKFGADARPPEREFKPRTILPLPKNSPYSKN